MENEYYGVASTPTEDYLAHYGIKGMKWGVRKAIASGNAKALGRQYRKAQKKLAKLEKRANSGKKYAKRAALLGAGAGALGAGALGVTVPGVRNAAINANRALVSKGIKTGVKTKDIVDASYAASKWGSKTHDVGNALSSAGTNANRALNSAGIKTGIKSKDIVDKAQQIGGGRTVSNSQLVRAGGLALGAGLAGAAGYNAYRAATTKRAAKKAAAFRAEMNKQFAGTKYANAPRTPQKKRKRG